jgi:hypothetical protein
VPYKHRPWFSLHAAPSEPIASKLLYPHTHGGLWVPIKWVFPFLRTPHSSEHNSFYGQFSSVDADILLHSSMGVCIEGRAEASNRSQNHDRKLCIEEHGGGRCYCLKQA